MSENTVAKLILPVGERDHIQGETDAPITIVEYGNYECVHCHRVHPIIKELQGRLGNRLRYVFRHLPITTIYPQTQLAAEAAEAAGAQGKFWEMHEMLLAYNGELTEDILVQYAIELGLNVVQFKQELADHVHASRVREDFSSAIRSGANGTPTFYLNDKRYDDPWDLESLLEAAKKPLGMKIRSLAQDFSQIAASGGVLLLLCTIFALLWANSTWAESYFHLWESALSFNLGELHLSEHLLEWVNDGLMVIFFFVVGLEIKREVTTGELATPKKAILPIAAALGGMVLPAALYAAFNAGGPGSSGWGIPMATDIAFTLGVMALLGRRIPLSLKVFFTALAIADDLGAVLVIAFFYTAHIEWIALAIGAVILAALFGLNKARVYSTVPYGVLGVALWLAFLESGVHPTIAGVLLAMTIPTRSPANVRALLGQTATVLDEVESGSKWRGHADGQYQAALQTLETVTQRMQSPAQRLEHELHPWTTYLILPIFALANAGVALSGEAAQGIFSPVSLGIIFGLVIGKPFGITLFSWLAVKIGWAELPADLNWKQIFAASWLAGIGFTMSLFIANAGLTDPATLASAKIAVFTASLLAGGAGWILVTKLSPSYDQSTQIHEPTTDGEVFTTVSKSQV